MNIVFHIHKLQIFLVDYLDLGRIFSDGIHRIEKLFFLSQNYTLLKRCFYTSTLTRSHPPGPVVMPILVKFFLSCSWLVMSTHRQPARHYTVPNLDSPNVLFGVLFWSKPRVREFVRFFFKIILIIVIVNSCTSHNKCGDDSPLLKKVLFKNTNIIIEFHKTKVIKLNKRNTYPSKTLIRINIQLFLSCRRRRSGHSCIVC